MDLKELAFKTVALKLSKRHSADVLYRASKARPANQLLGAAFVYAFVAEYTRRKPIPDYSAAIAGACRHLTSIQ